MSSVTELGIDVYDSCKCFTNRLETSTQVLLLSYLVLIVNYILILSIQALLSGEYQVPILIYGPQKLKSKVNRHFILLEYYSLIAVFTLIKSVHSLTLLLTIVI